MSAIEWTDATWNPATGCTEVSEGCKYCYAKPLSKRLKAMGKAKYERGFEYAEHLDALSIPLHWKRPRKIFVNSMSDFFHEDSGWAFKLACLNTMRCTPQHTYQILTKRPWAMHDFVESLPGKSLDIPSNVWLGVSVENQRNADRIEALRSVPDIHRFISFEPLLGPVSEISLLGIGWAIIGGESGPHYRPVRATWITSVMDLCDSFRVPIFFKQWGGARPQTGGHLWEDKIVRNFPPEMVA